jgi:hypothetical protein
LLKKLVPDLRDAKPVFRWRLAVLTDEILLKNDFRFNGIQYYVLQKRINTLQNAFKLEKSGWTEKITRKKNRKKEEYR